MNSEIYPIIVCVAKMERDYIEEFIKYHLAIGFKYIYLYDNEDEATYDKILNKYLNNVTILHTPNNNYITGIKYMILEHFKNNILYQDNKITHVINIDIDEFIVLKKHKTISDFIYDYIKDDCEGIGINRVYFGSSGYKQKTDEPVTQRFIRCSNTADKRIKTLFKKDNFIDYGLCYNVKLRKGTIRNTRNEIIYGCNNITNIDLSIIQINKYKTKSYEEYMLMARRGKSSLNDIYNHYLGTKIDEIINNNFKIYDLNDKEDIIAKEYYKNNIINKIV